MTVLRLLKSRWMLALPVLLVLAAAVACGGEAATPTSAPTPTPQPTPTPVDFGALTQEIRGIVDEGIQGMEGLSAGDVEAIVDSAMAAIPEGLSSEDVQTIVASAISAIPEGLSAAEVQAIISTAISAIPEGLSAAAVQAIVAQAISEIPEGLTVDQMEAAIKSAVDSGVQQAVSEAVAQIPPTATPGAMMPGDGMMMPEGEYGGSITLYNYAYASHFDLHVAPALDSTRGARAAFNGLVHYNFKNPLEVPVTCAPSGSCPTMG